MEGKMMKKRSSMFVAFGMILTLAFSSTVYAGEIALSDTENQTETVMTQTEEQETNGLESWMYLLEEPTVTEEVVIEETKAEHVLVPLAQEELEALEGREATEETEATEKTAKTALIVFQPESFWKEDTQATESEVSETQTVEETVMSEQTEALTETEISEETQKDLPKITLTKEQKKQIQTLTKQSEETILITNGCVLKDELEFQKEKKIKAVFSLNEKTEQSFKEAMEKLELSKIYKEYQKKIKEAKKTETLAETEKKQETEPAGKIPGAEDGSMELSLARTGQTNAPTGTETGNTETETSTNTNMNTNTNTSTGAKDVIFTFVPDPVLEEEESVSATYKIKTTKPITNCTVTITFDATKMTLDSADSSDVFEDYDNLTINEVDPKSTTVQGGKIVFSFSSPTPIQLNGDMLDLWFDLKGSANPAKKGDTYNFDMTVNTLKNGTTNLTSEVKNAAMVAEEDTEDEEPEETESETTKTTEQTQSSETGSTSSTEAKSTPNSAAKTGDNTQVGWWLTLMSAAFVIVTVEMGRKRQAKNRK